MDQEELRVDQEELRADQEELRTELAHPRAERRPDLHGSAADRTESEVPSRTGWWGSPDENRAGVGRHRAD